MQPPPATSVLRATASAVLALAFGLAGVLAAAERPDDSPFAPAGSGNGAPTTPTASPLDRYEFTSVMTLDGETYVTLVDTSTSKSITLTPGQQLEGVTLASFSSEDGKIEIEVEANGQRRTMKPREAKIVAMAMPTPTPAPNPGAQPPGQPGNNAVNTPISDEEARARMQRVAEEIRRRREMRRQMLQQQQNPSPPGNPPNG